MGTALRHVHAFKYSYVIRISQCVTDHVYYSDADRSNILND